MPELEATAPPIPFWFYRVVAGAAEPWGQLRRRRACNNTVRSRTPDEDADDENEHAADDDLEGGLQERRVHIAGADP
jgi:hypothetical protein